MATDDCGFQDVKTVEGCEPEAEGDSQQAVTAADALPNAVEEALPNAVNDRGSAAGEFTARPRESTSVNLLVTSDDDVGGVDEARDLHAHKHVCVRA